MRAQRQEQGSREQEVTCVMQHEGRAGVGDRSGEVDEAQLMSVLGQGLEWQVP